MWWDHGGWGGGEWLAMSVMMALFWCVLGALVVWSLRRSRERSAPSAGAKRSPKAPN